MLGLCIFSILTVHMYFTCLFTLSPYLLVCWSFLSFSIGLLLPTNLAIRLYCFLFSHPPSLSLSPPSPTSSPSLFYPYSFSLTWPDHVSITIFLDTRCHCSARLPYKKYVSWSLRGSCACIVVLFKKSVRGPSRLL